MLQAKVTSLNSDLLSGDGKELRPPVEWHPLLEVEMLRYSMQMAVYRLHGKLSAWGALIDVYDDKIVLRLTIDGAEHRFYALIEHQMLEYVRHCIYADRLRAVTLKEHEMIASVAELHDMWAHQRLEDMLQTLSLL